MYTNENALEDIGDDRLIEPCIKVDYAFGASLPNVLAVVPLKLNLVPPHWLCSPTMCDQIAKTNKDSSVTIELPPNPSSNNPSEIREQCAQDCPLEQGAGENFPVLQTSLASETSSKSMDQTVPDTRRAEGQLQLIKSWLLRPFSFRSSMYEKRDEAFLDTLLHIAEDRMYLYGLYDRIEREELTGAKQPGSRKRGRAWEYAQSLRKRTNSDESGVLPGSAAIPFSFVQWSQNASKPGIEVDRLRWHSFQPSSIISPDERNVLSRYALSSGKLRKECADPYQFLTARLQELRHGLGEELPTGTKDVVNSKENT